jgi:hypothetical protein
VIKNVDRQSRGTTHYFVVICSAAIYIRSWAGAQWAGSLPQKKKHAGAHLIALGAQLVFARTDVVGVTGGDVPRELDFR